MSADERTIVTNRKRRGVVRASITRIARRVSELEAKEELAHGDLLTVQGLLHKLNGLDTDFKSYHFAIVDAVEDESLQVEQDALNEHDDRVSFLTTRAQRLIAPPSSDSVRGRTGRPSSTCTMETSTQRQQLLSRLLDRLEKKLKEIIDSIKAAEAGDDVDTCVMLQYEEQLSGYKSELSSVSRDILSIEDTDELAGKESELSKILFDAA